MVKKIIVAFMYVLSLSYIHNFLNKNAQDVDESKLETYIVHVSLPKNQVLSEPQDLTEYYRSFLPKTKSSALDGPLPLLVYSYKHVAHGFAAKLTPEHIKFMEKERGFLFTWSEQTFALHTTRTPNFLGLHQYLGIWKDSDYGKGVIVGVLDTGITPDHPSFNDKEVPPPPKKWKGKCESENKTLCNNRLIGARSSGNGPTQLPLDWYGHGIS